MLELVQAIFLGVVQGLTEFLPVSSSGHLLLGQYFLGLDQDRFGLPFDAAIHTGTVLAVVSFFWRDLLTGWPGVLCGFAARPGLLRPPSAHGVPDPGRLTVPAGIIGFLFQDFFERRCVRRGWWSFNLVLVGVLFIVGEAVGSQTRSSDKLTFREAVGIGLAQATALVPGLSRSGATITLGLFLGLRRDEAARFSFLMSVPITAPPRS